MGNLVERILNIPPIWVYVAVGALVFVEDAIFVGFVVPGETAAVIGGVAASQEHVHLSVVLIVVVLAAIIGDTVGFEVGKLFGPWMLRQPIVERRRERLDRARDLLARRGGVAVFLGRFVAFFRAVMPALAGISRMPYRRFVVWNIAGGLVWGVGFVLLGFLAGNSYDVIAKTVGRTAAIVVAVLVVLGLIAWRIHEHRANRRTEEATLDTEPG